MIAGPRQLGLFGDDLAAGRAADAVRGGPLRCYVVVTRQNPCGRSRLTFRYRPERRHLVPHDGGPQTVADVACELLAEYFAAVGGFRIVTSETVAAWADLLVRVKLTSEQVCWAIAAKAASLVGRDEAESRTRRVTYTGSPLTFARACGYWLSVSVEQRRRVAELQAERARQGWRRLADRLAAARRRAGELQAEAGARLRELAHRRPPGGDTAAAGAFWVRLTPDQQAAALRAVQAACNRYLRQAGDDPASGVAEEMREAWAVAWARDVWPDAARLEGGPNRLRMPV